MQNVFSQNKDVSGEITDTSGNLLPSLSVVIQGTSIGTATDVDGEVDKFTWSATETTVTLTFTDEDGDSESMIFEVIENEKPNILLLSSVLQYISKPYDLLNELLKNNFEIILIDRTMFSKTNKKIKLQSVPPKIYKASYPCWFLDELEFINYFESNNYNIIESFETLGGQSREYIFKGFIAKKNV